MPDQIHQVGGVFAVMNGESGIEADLVGIVAQQTRSNPMKGTRPGQCIGHDAGIVTPRAASEMTKRVERIARKVRTHVRSSNPEFAVPRSAVSRLS